MSAPDPRMRRYLLGELSEAEATAFEREFFGNAGVFAALVEAETTLIDDYVRRRLPPPLRARFEQHYLADPRRRARVEFSDALATRIGEAESAGPVPSGAVRARTPDALAAFGSGRLWRVSAAAALVLLMAATGWLSWESSRLRGELARSETARARAEQRAAALQDRLTSAEANAQDLASERERGGVPSFVSLLLTVPSARTPESGSAPTLAIPPGTREVRIELAMGEAEYPSYRVSLSPVGGANVFTRQGLAPRRVGAGARIGVTVPAGRLAAGDHMITVDGERPGAPPETVSELLFRVAPASSPR